MNTLNADIKNKTFKKLYLLYGEESFLKRSYKSRLKEAIVGDDTMNYSYFAGKGIPVPEVIGFADTLPFFSEHRLLIIEDSGFFKNATEELVKYLPHLPATTHIIFIESEVDKRGKMFKTVKEMGYVTELVRQSTQDLSKWVLGKLAKEEKKITGTTMELFLSKTGEDMEIINMELEKLICYTMGKEVVSAEDVEAVCSGQIANRIFDMTGFLAERNKKAALAVYEDLLILKEPPMRILFLIARQFNQLMQVKELGGKGFDRSAIASKLKIPPFVAGKTINQARSFTKEQLVSYVTACVDSEEAVKRGRLADRLAVELLIIM